MQSKYHASEIEKLLDSIMYKIDWSYILRLKPSTSATFKENDILSANVVMSFIKDIINFDIQNPDKFLEFVKTKTEYSLLSKDQLERLLSISNDFIGVYPNIKDIPANVTNGSFTIVTSDTFGRPNVAIKIRNNWIWLNGESKHIVLGAREIIDLGSIDYLYDFAKLYIWAQYNESIHLLESNLIKSKNVWLMQHTNNTKFPLQIMDPLFETWVIDKDPIGDIPSLKVRSLRDGLVLKWRIEQII